MVSFSVIIDDRERLVIPNLECIEKWDIQYSIEHLSIGDYALCKDKKIIAIIERKTLKDLASSFKDGRKSNIDKLIKLREQTGCRIIYIIEGPYNPLRIAKICRIPYKNLQAHLDHLMFRDAVHIIYTLDQKHTLERIFELLRNYSTIKGLPASVSALSENKAQHDEANDETPPQNKTPSEPLELLKQKIRVNEKYIHKKILTAIPKLGMATAGFLIDNGIYINNLLTGEFDPEIIGKFNYSGQNKRISRIMMHRILGIKDNPDRYLANILKKIPGIGPKRSNMIRKYKILDIIGTKTGGEECRKELIKKLGEKQYTMLIKYLCMRTPPPRDI